MCHQYVCADCATISWDFCTEANDFTCCPHYSRTTYKTERRCDACIRISGVIVELGYWLARHPEQSVDYEGPQQEDDSISVKSFTDSDDEDMDKKVVAKADSPWGCQSGTTIDAGDIEDITNDKGKENVPPDDEEYQESEQDESDDEEDAHSDTNETVSHAIFIER